MTVIRWLAVYLPFQEILLKWLPVPDQIFLLLRQVPDLMLFGLMAAVIAERIMRQARWRVIGGGADFFLLAFVVWCVVTLALNPGANLFTAIANIKAILRYLVLFYLVLLFAPGEREIQRLLSWLRVALAIQCAVGLIQFAGGVQMRDVLAARNVQEGIGDVVIAFTGDKFEGVNDLMGTMGNNISFGYFMLVGLLLVLSNPGKDLKRTVLAALFCLLILLSGARIILIAGVLAVGGYVLIRMPVWQAILFALVIAPGLAIAVLYTLIYIANSSQDIDNTSFLFIFRAEYIQIALNQRLGILLYILPELLTDAWYLVGYSADKGYLASQVIPYIPGIPYMIVAVAFEVLEDVYWVAMLMYFGFIGVAFWVLFLQRLFIRLWPLRRSADMLTRRLSYVACSLIILSVPLNLLNQAYEVRSFSFYTWLFCALALHRAFMVRGTADDGPQDRGPGPAGFANPLPAGLARPPLAGAGPAPAAPVRRASAARGPAREAVQTADVPRAGGAG